MKVTADTIRKTLRGAGIDHAHAVVKISTTPDRSIVVCTTQQWADLVYVTLRGCFTDGPRRVGAYGRGIEVRRFESEDVAPCPARPAEFDLDDTAWAYLVYAVTHHDGDLDRALSGYSAGPSDMERALMRSEWTILAVLPKRRDRRSLVASPAGESIVRAGLRKDRAAARAAS